MPNSSNSPEAAAIEAAYRAHVELLFKSLVTNLGDQVVSHQSDQQSLDKFKAGLNIAKRAKRLALSAVAPALAVRPAASRSGKRKEQSRRRHNP
jgi:hypothetical protein